MSKFENLTARSRYFRVLLYPDNPLHVEALEIIKQRYPHEYVGITHSEQEGEKEHMHIVLSFKNPRITSSVCAVLGFEDASGMPDDKFVRAICKQQKRKVDAQYKDCLLYLTHINAPEKELYDWSDLFGDKDLIDYVRRLIVKYSLNTIDMSDSVNGCLDWIAQQDSIITAFQFGKWITSSPYFKANANKIVWSVLKEHNLKIYNRDNPVPDHFDSVAPEGAAYLSLSSRQLEEWEMIFRD